MHGHAKNILIVASSFVWNNIMNSGDRQQFWVEVFILINN